MNLIIVGATGLVGQEFLKLLQYYNFNFNIRLIASNSSKGKVIEYKMSDIVSIGPRKIDVEIGRVLAI